MVQIPCESAIVAFDAFDRFITNVSLLSRVVSPRMVTVIICVVTPAAKVSVPAVELKSLDEDAVPLAVA